MLSAVSESGHSPSALEARALASVSARLRAIPKSIGRYAVLSRVAERRDGLLCDVATFYEAAGQHATARDYRGRCPSFEDEPAKSTAADEADDGPEER